MSITILEATLDYLRLSCIWPGKDRELNPGKLHYIKFALMLLSTTGTLIGCVLHLVVSIQHGSTNIGEDIVLIIAETGVYYFITVFVCYQTQIAKIYADLSDFKNSEKPYDFEKKNNRLKFLAKLYTRFIDFAIVNCCLLCIVLKGYCEKQNLQKDFKEVCGLIVTAWMPFDISHFPLKQLVYVMQVYSIAVTFKGAALISWALCETMEQLIIRIQHLKLMISTAVDTEDDDLAANLLVKSIQCHINIYNIGARADKYYTGCLFLHIVCSGALFGFTGYRIKEALSTLSLCLLAGWFMSLFIVCISGQHLKDEAVSVGDAAYNSKWYDRNLRFQRNIFFIILRSQRPIVIHAGPFTYVSHLLILAILKTAYSYLTLLNATSI